MDHNKSHDICNKTLENLGGIDNLISMGGYGFMNLDNGILWFSVLGYRWDNRVSIRNDMDNGTFTLWTYWAVPFGDNINRYEETHVYHSQLLPVLRSLLGSQSRGV